MNYKRTRKMLLVSGIYSCKFLAEAKEVSLAEFHQVYLCNCDEKKIVGNGKSFISHL